MPLKEEMLERCMDDSCPECASSNIKNKACGGHGGVCHMIVHCLDCGCQYDEEYWLVDVTLFNRAKTDV